ncbi:MAG: serine/threonine protein kinase [Planctomycetes bacterium]|nr:serine/threonine protein kinase [Planctomycetota bacterium]
MTGGPGWAEVRATFEDLCDHPPAERARRLEVLAATRPELSDPVRRLLDADTSEVLPAIEPPPTSPLGAARWLRLDAGSSIAGFRIVRFLAQGGMGAVYEVEQLAPRRAVALKILRPELCVGGTLRRFRLEAEVLARLDHVGIAKVHAAGLEAIDSGPFALEVPWYALEYLADALPITARARVFGLSLDTCVEWMIAVGEAIHHAHQRGVIHRDLKPGNVLVGRDRKPKIVDFGIARAQDHDADAERTQAGMVLGTQAYMSPEQRAGVLDLDLRTDIYALGKILDELCRPVATGTHATEIEWIVAKAAHAGRDERYTSATRARPNSSPICARSAPANRSARRHRREGTASASCSSDIAARSSPRWPSCRSSPRASS